MSSNMANKLDASKSFNDYQINHSFAFKQQQQLGSLNNNSEMLAEDNKTLWRNYFQTAAALLYQQNSSSNGTEFTFFIFCS